MTLPANYITRRQNANPAAAGITTFLFGLFASVPIGIRQRDWRVPVFSFGAGFLVVMAGLAKNNEGFQVVYKLAGQATGGLVTFALVNKNKQDNLNKFITADE